MTTNLAPKQDLEHMSQLMVTRFEALESRTALVMENLESRLLMKLGILMTVLFGVAGTALTLMR